MTATKRCVVCVGSGTIMGGGMIFVDCAQCAGTGKLYLQEPQEFKINKESASYLESVDRLLVMGMTRTEAEEILDKALANDQEELTNESQNVDKGKDKHEARPAKQHRKMAKKN